VHCSIYLAIDVLFLETFDEFSAFSSENKLSHAAKENDQEATVCCSAACI
jgi:hypothetical protein